MENSTKALYIVASVFVAVIILSLVVLLFDQINDSSAARDKANEEKTLTEFNAEYDVFNKRLMYGADVISCINKAISNNVSAQEKNEPDLYIDVLVHLNEPIEETFKVWRIKKGKTVTIPSDDSDLNDIKAQLTIIDGANLKIEKLFNCGSNIKSGCADKRLNSLGFFSGSNFEDKKAFNGFAKSSAGDYYHLLVNGKPSNSSNITDLEKLVSTKEEYTYNFTTTNGQYCIKWTTVFKEFRKTPFSCVDIEYNSNTGRINKLIFESKSKNK